MPIPISNPSAFGLYTTLHIRSNRGELSYNINALFGILLYIQICMCVYLLYYITLAKCIVDLILLAIVLYTFI